MINKKNKFILFIGLFLNILSIILFICAHYIGAIALDLDYYMMFGIDVWNFIEDFLLFTSIIILIILTLMWVYIFIEKDEK